MAMNKSKINSRIVFFSPIPAAIGEDYMVTNPLVVSFGTGPNDIVSHGDLIGSTSTSGTITILDDSILEEAEDLSVILIPSPPDTSTIMICDDEGNIITSCGGIVVKWQ